MKKFPPMIFVTVEGDGDDEFLNVQEGALNFAEPGRAIKAARYKLYDTVVVTAETIITPSKPKRKGK